ncbi:MAG: ATP-binding protein, partial [Verrucomicrobiota bacterium]|nr:ATP-binding protein [Verrucomicrobiota bacterium]
RLSRQFPVLGLLGPRQSGKTTLAKALFPHYKYVNLEELDTREFASNDPRRFLKTLEGSPGVILDEIQRVPDLLSYIQAHVDEWQKPGFFVLTGSENILLNHHISQTLAGRIALTTLLPLSLEELHTAHLTPKELDEMLFRGFYPSLYAKHIETRDWIQSYIQTYIERDVRNLKQITDLSVFQKFLQLCAGRIGQLLDLTSIGNDCGITAHTVRSWLSILEATYVIFLLHPHHKNFSKRLIKTPKLYFYDSAIACHLLSIQSPQDLAAHYLRGGLFESMILSDLMKQRFNAGHVPNLYFWRDKSGHEVDCMIEQGTQLIPIEIKSGETLSADFFANLVKWNHLSGNPPSHSYVIYGGHGKQIRSQGTALGWTDIAQIDLFRYK